MGTNEERQNQLKQKSALSQNERDTTEEDTQHLSKLKNQNSNTKGSMFFKNMENLLNSKIGIIITFVFVIFVFISSISSNSLTPDIRLFAGCFLGIFLITSGIFVKKGNKMLGFFEISIGFVIIYIYAFTACIFSMNISIVYAIILMLVGSFGITISAVVFKKFSVANIGLILAYIIPFLLDYQYDDPAFLITFNLCISIFPLILSHNKQKSEIFNFIFWTSWLIATFIIIWTEAGGLLLKPVILSVSLQSLIFFVLLVLEGISSQRKKEKTIILLLCSNAVFYLFVSYWMLNIYTNIHTISMFFIMNAIFYSLVFVLLYIFKKHAKKIINLTLTFALTYIVLIIPVWLNSNIEAILILLISAAVWHFGKTKKIRYFETLSIPLLIASFASFIFFQFTTHPLDYENILEIKDTPFFNSHFLLSLVYSFVGGLWYYRHRKYESFTTKIEKQLHNSIAIVLFFILFLSLPIAVLIETNFYWNLRFNHSEMSIFIDGQNFPSFFQNIALLKFKIIWLINFTFLFLSVFTLTIMQSVKSKTILISNLIINTLAISLFLPLGLYNLSLLREIYLNTNIDEIYHIGEFNIIIRYLSFLFAACLLFATYKLSHRHYLRKSLKMFFEILIIFFSLWVASAELFHIMNIIGLENAYSIGLTILWVFASFLLLLISKKNKKMHVIYASIGIIGLTLMKMLIYDISFVRTIPQTIFFLSTGVILTFVSFYFVFRLKSFRKSLKRQRKK